MRCKCGCLMIWHMDYVNGIAVSWYSCPSCGYDTRNQQYTWSDRTYKTESEESELYAECCKKYQKTCEIYQKAFEQIRTEILEIIRFEDKWLLDANSHNEDTKIAFDAMLSKITQTLDKYTGASK